VKLRTALIVGGCALALTAAALTATGKDKEPPAQMVDSGSFGVWTGGHRVATETFTVQQQTGGISIIASQLKEDAGSASQNSELQVTSAGALVRYEWHEQSPGKSELFVVPNNDFLKETVTQNPGDKPAEQPFLMPSTSLVLDNNFLIHREVLAWRYLSSCTHENGPMQCGPAQFGAIVPQERTSIRISVQPVGEEKITIRGSERHLLRLNLKSDDDEWAIWLDPQDHYKLVRVVKTGDNTEVVRD
jgi:hypothetical protein